MQIWSLHHTDFDKIAEIFEIQIQRNSLAKSQNKISPDEIRSLRRKLDSRMNNAFAYFRRRAIPPSAVVEDVAHILELYGPKKGRAYIEKIRKKRRAL